MTPPFSVRTTPRFDRLAKALAPRHPGFAARYDRAHTILAADPYNHTHAHPIKKLEGISAGEGQWRLALGRFRFRYSIFGREVWLF